MKLALKLDEEQLPETPEDGDFEAGYHKARLMALARGHWLTWAVRAVAALGLSAAVVLTDLGADLRNGNTPVSTSAKQSRAETHYLLCARNSTVIEEGKQQDVNDACIGYATLEESYKTEGVKPRHG